MIRYISCAGTIHGLTLRYDGREFNFIFDKEWKRVDMDERKACQPKTEPAITGICYRCRVIESDHMCMIHAENKPKDGERYGMPEMYSCLPYQRDFLKWVESIPQLNENVGIRAAYNLSGFGCDQDGTNVDHLGNKYQDLGSVEVSAKQAGDRIVIDDLIDSADARLSYRMAQEVNKAGQRYIDEKKIVAMSTTKYKRPPITVKLSCAIDPQAILDRINNGSY